MLAVSFCGPAMGGWSCPEVPCRVGVSDGPDRGFRMRNIERRSACRALWMLERWRIPSIPPAGIVLSIETFEEPGWGITAGCCADVAAEPRFSFCVVAAWR